MPTVIDQYHGDPLYTTLHVLTRDFPAARDFLKTANFEERKNSVDTLPSAAFAWEDARRFPVHTKEDTLASIFYRSKVAFHVPPEVDIKLTNAALIYKIDRSVFNQLKTASSRPVAYALPEEKRLPLGGIAQIKQAEEVLHRDVHVLSLEKRAEAFQNLYKAARRFQVRLLPKSIKMAGITMSDTAFIREWLEARSTAAAQEIHKEAYDKLAQGMQSLPRYVSDRPTLVKLASTIAELDTRAGLIPHYDRRLPDPLMTVFNMDKLAEPMCDVAGVDMPVSTLMQLPRDVWEQLDASEMADLAAQGNPETFMQAFSTLPLDIKVMVRENAA